VAGEDAPERPAAHPAHPAHRRVRRRVVPGQRLLPERTFIGLPAVATLGSETVDASDGGGGDGTMSGSAHEASDDLPRRRPLQRTPAPALADSEPDDAGGAGLSTREVQRLQRTAGNRAVTSVFGPARASSSSADGVRADGVAVQRWAWVGAQQVKPTDAGLDSAMQAFAADRVVRDYGSDAEFKAHAAGTTDYLGNLPGPVSKGTWVRFAPSGTNLLGENHTQVTLEQVVPAVGSKSFIYEPFSVDAMPAGSAMNAAYETENQARFAAMGVAGVADKRQFGSESLFPKIGFGLNLLQQILGSGNLDALKPAAYVGQPAQRYLKIAWGYGKDVPGEIAALRAARQKVPDEYKRLAAVHKRLSPRLDTFVTGLVVDGFLGDALDTRTGKAMVAPISEYCQAVVAAMLARSRTDATLTQVERDDLNAMKRGSAAEKQAVFDKWRNLHFSHAVRDAAARGVRYAGMGKLHLDYLVAEGIPGGSRTFDMTGAYLANAELLTKNLAASAKP
jgi:hypothetical protein